MSNPSRDVRMRGFAARTTVADAQAWVDAHARPLEAETVPLAAGWQRVLAADIASSVDVPGFDRAMMDGFALQAADLDGAGADSPRSLEIIGESFPGHPYAGGLSTGQTVRIMTGAPIPAGADAVLPVEQVTVDGSRILAHSAVGHGKHVGKRGEDIRAGQVILEAGRQLRPQDIGVLSSIGAAELPVIRQPRVRVIVTGNELLPAGTRPTGDRIADANSPMLLALIERDGGLGRCPGIVPDEASAIRAALEDDADVVLVSGGTSVGQEDLAPLLIREHGELPIHGISMRPGGPAGMGILDSRLVFLLPGNPVSCLCAYDLFAGRAIRLLGGRGSEWPYRSSTLPLSREIASVGGRCDCVRVIRTPEGIEPLVTGASLLSSASRADGFVMVPDDCEGHPAGAEVDVWWYP